MQERANGELFDAVSLQKKKVKLLSVEAAQKDKLIASLEAEKQKNAGTQFSVLTTSKTFTRCFGLMT